MAKLFSSYIDTIQKYTIIAIYVHIMYIHRWRLILLHVAQQREGGHEETLVKYNNMQNSTGIKIEIM